MKRKQIIIDYFISLGICGLIIACIFLDDAWNKRRPDEIISPDWNVSKSIAESKSSGKYLGRYTYDSLLSENKMKDSVYKELWFEKVEYLYYKEREGGVRIKVADSIFKDTLLCFPRPFNKVLDEAGYTQTWIDKKKGDTVYSCSASGITTLHHYPDTLQIIVERIEPVYKGKICIVKE